MSDKLYTYPIDKLLKWILRTEKKGNIFGISNELFFAPDKTDPFRTYRYGQLLETPVGVAAGPHTQMSQNIIAAWLTGSRYIELKTVQTLDELEVAKPCIEMKDEGYNCEWSQELKIKQSYEEYLNAWIIIHVLKDMFGWEQDEAGFIFNMSVGYDLQGIMKPNVQWFFDKMNDSAAEIEDRKELISEIYPRIKDIEIPGRISDNITLSTMHGCPPDEIESIAKYLIAERKLNTAVKLNPTLLGPEKLRYILNDKLGFKTVVPDIAFEHDLKFDDAVKLIKSLTETAEANNVRFGLKLTNTLESLNSTEHLPKDQQMVYMSGRALHPISVNLSAKLQNEFHGNLDISFSAGADAFNVAKILKCNIKPVTVCSDLLKPGGYTRTPQYIENISAEMKKVNANNLEEFVFAGSGIQDDINSAALENLNRYAEEVLEDKKYAKNFFRYDGIKTKRELTEFDCVQAPCIETCAISQDVPDYMYYTAKGDFDKAYEVILDGNPLPNITGLVCDHLCQTKCTRINYDEPLLIREIKRFVAEKFSDGFSLRGKPANGVTAAIIGGGPAGLSASYFLAREGFSVTVFEEKEKLGGMPSGAIPGFRIRDERIEEDINLLKKLGVRFKLNYQIDKSEFEALRKKYDYVFIGVGAKSGKKLGIEGEDTEKVFDQLEFLNKTRDGSDFDLGESVAVIGAGNSAMDAARTAKRIVGKDNKVTVVYRRTIEQAPADKEEINALLEEGIEFIELAAPLKILDRNGKKVLVCQMMKLGAPDSSGRRKPEPVDNEIFELSFDSIITAIGQDVVADFFPEPEIKADEVTRETQIHNVFAGGDVIRGADTLINAIADGKYTAEEIIKRAGAESGFGTPAIEKGLDKKDYQKLISRKIPGVKMPVVPEEKRLTFELVHPTLDDESAMEEASRCMLCNDVCNICVSDCPNLANISYDAEKFEVKYPVVKIAGKEIEIVDKKTFRNEQNVQIVNIGDFCNECGNCETFCPTAGAPYKTKPTFYLDKSAYLQEDDCYFIDKNKIYYKSGKEEILMVNDNILEFESEDLHLKVASADFSIIAGKSKKEIIFDLKKIAELYYLYKNLKSTPLFNQS